MFWFERLNQTNLWQTGVADSADTANHKLPIRTIEPPGTIMVQRPELHRIWHEFMTGMQMLYKHGRRTNACAEKVTGANLRLLHNNLRVTTTYKELLTHLKRHCDNQTLFYHWPLSDNHKADCSLIHIAKASRQETNLNHVLGDFVFRYFNERIQSGNRQTHSATCMYLVISGKLLVSRTTSETRSSGSGNTKKTFSITSYKSGDVLLITEKDKQHIVDIRSNQKHTQLFGVYFNENG
jgi:hypothetical protein